MLNHGCRNCPVKDCDAIQYGGSRCAALRDRFGLADPSLSTAYSLEYRGIRCVEAEQRVRIKALEKENANLRKENEGLRANAMIMEKTMKNRHNPNDVDIIVRLMAENGELRRQLEENAKATSLAVE